MTGTPPQQQISCLLPCVSSPFSLNPSFPKPSISSVSETLRRQAVSTGVQKSFIDLGDSEEEEEGEEEDVDVGMIAADSVTAAPGTFIGTIMVRSRENHMTLHSSICGVVCRNLIQSHACECVLFRRTMKISLEQNEVLRRQMLHWPGKPTAIHVYI